MFHKRCIRTSNHDPVVPDTRNNTGDQGPVASVIHLGFASVGVCDGIVTDRGVEVCVQLGMQVPDGDDEECMQVVVGGVRKGVNLS